MQIKGGVEMGDLSNTQFFQVEPGPQISAKDILEIVFKALKEKGYNPVKMCIRDRYRDGI